MNFFHNIGFPKDSFKSLLRPEVDGETVEDTLVYNAIKNRKKALDTQSMVSQPDVGSSYAVSDQVTNTYTNGPTQRQGLRGAPSQDTSNSSRHQSPRGTATQPRLLPSQSHGSYQNSPFGKDPTPPRSSSGARSGSDVLKDRFRKGKPGSSGGGSLAGRDDKPFMAASTPWANSEADFDGAGGSQR